MSEAEELLQELRKAVNKIDELAYEVNELTYEIEGKDSDLIDLSDVRSLMDMADNVNEVVTDFQESQGWI